MVILFIVAGALFGAAGAGVALWLGGSILLALASYSVFGSIGAISVVFALYLFSGTKPAPANWQDGKNPQGPISA